MDYVPQNEEQALSGMLRDTLPGISGSHEQFRARGYGNVDSSRPKATGEKIHINGFQNQQSRLENK